MKLPMPSSKLQTKAKREVWKFHTAGQILIDFTSALRAASHLARHRKSEKSQLTRIGRATTDYAVAAPRYFQIGNFKLGFWNFFGVWNLVFGVLALISGTAWASDTPSFRTGIGPILTN